MSVFSSFTIAILVVYSRNYGRWHYTITFRRILPVYDHIPILSELGQYMASYGRNLGITSTIILLFNISDRLLRLIDSHFVE